MSIVEELNQYLELDEDNLETFLVMLKDKGFLEKDNSWSLLVKMFEISHNRGVTKAYKEMALEREARNNQTSKISL